MDIKYFAHKTRKQDTFYIDIDPLNPESIARQVREEIEERERAEEYGIDLDPETRWVTDRKHDRCAIQGFFDRERAKGNHNPIAMISCRCSRCRVHC